MAQPVTLASIEAARSYAKSHIEVELLAVCFEEDADVVNDNTFRKSILRHSLQTLLNNTGVKKLPFIKEILDTAYQSGDAGFVIFTNMDIALMPYFYLTVKEYVKEGHDAIVVNRRGISSSLNSSSELYKMYAELGDPHPGYDCFVIKRELLPKFVLGNICTGVAFLEVALMHNIIAFSNNPLYLTHHHLTFHIGREVMPPLNEVAYKHNRNEYEQNIYPKLKSHLSLDKYPYSLLPLYKRLLKWALNPVFRTHLMAEMEGKNMLRKIKFAADRVRFKWLENLR